MPEPEGIAPAALIFDESKMAKKGVYKCVSGFKKIDIAPVRYKAWEHFI